MQKKYEFTGETQKFNGRVLNRIRRLSDGVIGGWIESEDNLSHEGGCWVGDEARVFGEARVFDEAWVFGEARVYGGALVFGQAIVFDRALVCGNDQIS